MNEKEKARPPRASSKTKNKRTNFYVALYACVGVMLTLAVIIGVNQMAGPRAVGDGTTPTPTVRPTIPPTNNQQPGAQAPGNQQTPGNNQQPGNNQESNVQPSPAPTAPPGTGNQGANNAVPNATEDGETVAVFSPEDGMLNISPYDDFANETYDYSLGFYENCYECCILETGTQYYQPLGFTAFTEDSRMAWPVLGDIIMEYSTTALIFNPTLNSWRVNPNVAIESPKGTPVLAAASGKVTEVTTTRELGRTITIYHSNGWSTTYSQLQADVRVRVGDVVQQGHIIGYVGEPSHHSSALAPHVAFQVFQNDATVNPRTILAAR